MEKGPISQFITHNYRHFNSACVVDAAKAYCDLLDKGGKMFLAMAGAMSTAEIGLSLAEMIRQDKFSFVCCSANNLEEDIMNLVAHSHYYRIPGYRDLTPQQEQELLENHYNRVTDTCIPEEEAFRRLEGALVDVWTKAKNEGKRYFPYEYIFFIIGYCLSLHNLGINSMKFFHIAFSYFESSYWNSINYLYTFLEIILSPVSSKLFYTGCYYFQINIIGFQVGHNSS
jgi:deoxyhypusine synthase